MPPRGTVKVTRPIGFGADPEPVVEVGVVNGQLPPWAAVWKALSQLVTERDGEWCGIPATLPGLGLVVEDRYPHRERVAELQAIVGENEAVPEPDAEAQAAVAGWRVVNGWRAWTRQGNGHVLVTRHDDGRTGHGFVPDAPQRNKHLLGPLSTLDAWDLDAELTAVDALAGLLTERMFKAYVLTGSFLETSKRSGLVYLFRRCRPTIVLTPHKGDEMQILACLCLHPLAYYAETFAGALVPTDDVIAHLLLMRGDEHLYWRRANQHHPLDPESGL